MRQDILDKIQDGIGHGIETIMAAVVLSFVVVGFLMLGWIGIFGARQALTFIGNSHVMAGQLGGTK